MDDILFLNDTFSVYFHDPLDEDWRNESYIKMMDIGSSEDYWTFENIVGENITKGIFFLTREHVFPCWDDPSNIQGGCLSIKILKPDMMHFWETLCAKFLTETLLKPEFRKYWNHVTGVSTSPKRHFCIVKIWVGCPELAKPSVFDLPGNYNGEIIYKTNLSNISHENIRLSNLVKPTAQPV
jgi:hypothetical protein